LASAHNTTVAVLEKMSVEFDVAEFYWDLSAPSGVLEITLQLRVESDVYFSARFASSDERYAFGSRVVCDVVTPFLLSGVHTFYITLGAT
jgi:hypothetical protein